MVDIRKRSFHSITNGNNMRNNMAQARQKEGKTSFLTIQVLSLSLWDLGSRRPAWGVSGLHRRSEIHEAVELSQALMR